MSTDSDKPNLICRSGRTPEEELRYRVENRLSLRDEPPTEEEIPQIVAAIFEKHGETCRLLADA